MCPACAPPSSATAKPCSGSKAKPMRVCADWLDSSAKSEAQTASHKLNGQLPEARSRLRGLLTPFRRVLLHDSTVEALPDHLAKIFPGSRNQHKSFAALKIQFISDLLSGQALHLSLSGFTRNDQAAAPDI